MFRLGGPPGLCLQGASLGCGFLFLTLAFKLLQSLPFLLALTLHFLQALLFKLTLTLGAFSLFSQQPAPGFFLGDFLALLFLESFDFTLDSRFIQRACPNRRCFGRLRGLRQGQQLGLMQGQHQKYQGQRMNQQGQDQRNRITFEQTPHG